MVKHGALIVMEKCIELAAGKPVAAKVMEGSEQIVQKSDELHIILSPEGTMSRTAHWRKGFYYMAHGANVPIVVGYIDYKKKILGIKGVIRTNPEIKETMQSIMVMYKDIHAKYPEKFELDHRFN